MPLKQTHTFVILELSPEAFNEIKHLLLEASYHHAFTTQDGREVIDMHGIAVAPTPATRETVRDESELEKLRRLIPPSKYTSGCGDVS